MKAALDAVNEMQRRVNNGTYMPNNSPPSRSYDSGSRRSRSRGSSNYENAPPPRSMSTLTIYSTNSYAPTGNGSEVASSNTAGTYMFYAGDKSLCRVNNTYNLKVYRHVLRVPSGQSDNIYSHSLNDEVERNKRAWGHGNGFIHVTNSRSGAENWLRSHGCAKINP